MRFLPTRNKVLFFPSRKKVHIRGHGHIFFFFNLLDRGNKNPYPISGVHLLQVVSQEAVPGLGIVESVSFVRGATGS